MNNADTIDLPALAAKLGLKLDVTPVSAIDAFAAAAKPETPPPDDASENAFLATQNLNKRHAWIEDVGRVLTEYADGSFRFQSIDSFTTTYNNRWVSVLGKDGESRRAPLGTHWLKSRDRRSYERVGLYPPPVRAPLRALNLWKGYAVEPRPGDWPLTRAHIRDVIAAGDPALDEYIIKWCAFLVQRPGLPAEVALVLKGGRGTGKGRFAATLRSLVEPHACHLSGSDQLTGRFNAALESSVLCFADESFWSGDRSAHGALKRLITEPTLRIERKGLEAHEAPNRLHVLIASNEDWVVPAGPDERRFVVCDVSKARAQDHAYFSAIERELASGGREAMLHDLLALDLGDWHPRRFVDTAALRDQQERSLSPVERWLLGLLDEGVLPRTLGAAGWAPPGWASSDALLEQVRGSTKELHDLTARSLATALKSIGADGGRKHRHGPARVRGWQFPPLADARARWETAFVKVTWSEADDWT